MSNETAWHKSSYSEGATNCVEVAEGQVTGVRDTQHRRLTCLEFSAPEWGAFLADLKAEAR